MSIATYAPATDRQVDFLKTLFTEAQAHFAKLAEAGHDDVVARLTPQVERIQDTLVVVLQGGTPSKAEASTAISTLIEVNKAAKVSGGPAGLKDYERSIPNRYAHPCIHCGEMVHEGEGFAALSRGRWDTICATCANETQVERQARLQRAIDARRVERDAESEGRKDVLALNHDTLVRAHVIDNDTPAAWVAIPSATGNNDLDFFKVTVAHVFRVLGGHNDQVLSVEQAVQAAERIVCTDDLKGAMATFGQELHFCGKCGRHLTDETSRALGLGPVCAGSF